MDTLAHPDCILHLGDSGLPLTDAPSLPEAAMSKSTHPQTAYGITQPHPVTRVDTAPGLALLSLLPPPLRSAQLHSSLD